METYTEIQPRLSETGGRLVVFVPENLGKIPAFAHQIYLLAISERRDVLYIALDREETDQPAVARLLATLTALTQDASVRVRARAVRAQDGLEALRHATRPGDRVVWTEARLVAPPGLESELGISQRLLPGDFSAGQAREEGWLRTALFWLATLIFVAGFTYLQLALREMTGSEGVKKALLVLLFSVEMGVIYAWYRVAGRPG